VLRPLACIGCCLLLAACGSGSFSIADATVDASYTCAAGSNNAPYVLLVTAAAVNTTSKSVDVRSVSAVMVLAAVKGVWQQQVGSTYEAGEVQFAPKTIGAASRSTLKVAIPSACTNGQHQGAADSYGEYTVKLTIVTSAGTFKLTSQNKHRILAP